MVPTQLGATVLEYQPTLWVALRRNFLPLVEWVMVGLKEGLAGRRSVHREHMTRKA
ncbi:hypothetical protein FOZ60_014771, partial [Perkinsus olseni]